MNHLTEHQRLARIVLCWILMGQGTWITADYFALMVRKPAPAVRYTLFYGCLLIYYAACILMTQFL